MFLKICKKRRPVRDARDPSKHAFAVAALGSVVLMAAAGCPTAFPFTDLLFGEVTDSANPMVSVATVKDSQESFGVVAERDSAGNPTVITQILYASEMGNTSILKIGSDGLPETFEDLAGNRIVFENYTNSTVDISSFDSLGNLIEGPKTVGIDPTELDALKSLFSSIGAGATLTSKAGILTDIGSGLKFAARGLSFTACAYSTGFALGTGGAAFPVFLVACGSFALSEIANATKDKIDDQLVTILNVGLCAPPLLNFSSCLSLLSQELTFLADCPPGTSFNTNTDDCRNAEGCLPGWSRPLNRESGCCPADLPYVWSDGLCNSTPEPEEICPAAEKECDGFCIPESATCCGDGSFCSSSFPICVERDICCPAGSPLLCPNDNVCRASLSNCPGPGPPPAAGQCTGFSGPNACGPCNTDADCPGGGCWTGNPPAPFCG